MLGVVSVTDPPLGLDRRMVVGGTTNKPWFSRSIEPYTAISRGSFSTVSQSFYRLLHAHLAREAAAVTGTILNTIAPDPRSEC